MIAAMQAHGGAVLEAQLCNLGFVQPRGSDVYRLGEFELHCEGLWLTITANSGAQDRVQTNFGQPGLWRSVVIEGRGTRRVFDLPAGSWMTHPDGSDEEETGARLAACLNWALGTARGEPVADWVAPPLEQVNQFMPRGSTTVRVGDIVRECALVREDDDRLALHCPLVPAIGEDLASSRRQWLEELMVATQQSWRMVRVGSAGSSLIVEVELTGVPGGALAGILDAALASMRSAVSWAAKPAAVIVSDIESVILESSPNRRQSVKGATDA